MGTSDGRLWELASLDDGGVWHEIDPTTGDGFALAEITVSGTDKRTPTMLLRGLIKFGNAVAEHDQKHGTMEKIGQTAHKFLPSSAVEAVYVMINAEDFGGSPKTNTFDRWGEPVIDGVSSLFPFSSSVVQSKKWIVTVDLIANGLDAKDAVEIWTESTLKVENRKILLDPN